MVKIYVKYMVSTRCKMILHDELLKVGAKAFSIEMGYAEIHEDFTPEQRESLSQALLGIGLEVMDNPKSILIERISSLIVELVSQKDNVPETNYSDYISEKLGYDYTYLANVFSEVKGITIQQFIIMNRIERVKELLVYDELNLTEISYALHYSSVAHLSMQFKKNTGLSPSYYKKLKQKRNEINHGL